MSIETLSDVPLFAARPSRRIEPRRKATSWIAVGIVHLVMFNFLVLTREFPDLIRHGVSQETFINLTGSPDETQQQVKPVVPQAQQGAPPETLIPPPPIPLPPPLPQAPVFQQQGGEQQKGDVLGALGREIACSPGHYENLTEVQRTRCGRVPWEGAIAPNGTIVLNRPANVNRFAPPPPEYVVRGQDAQRLQVERAQTDCPASLLNVPCIRVPRSSN